MPDYVRVKDKGTGHEFTVLAEQVNEHMQVLDKPALGRDGLPAPVKYRAPRPRGRVNPDPVAGAEAASEDHGQQANTDKENQ